MAVPTHYVKKRDLLWNPRTPPATLVATGREFLKQELYSDALDFFEKARDEPGLREIKRVALEQGDSFLLARLERFDRNLVTPGEWEAGARAAEKLGKPSMAAFIERKLHPPAVASEVALKPGEVPLEETGEVADQKAGG